MSSLPWWFPKRPGEQCPACPRTAKPLMLYCHEGWCWNICPDCHGCYSQYHQGNDAEFKDIGEPIGRCVEHLRKTKYNDDEYEHMNCPSPM